MVNIESSKILINISSFGNVKISIFRLTFIIVSTFIRLFSHLLKKIFISKGTFRGVWIFSFRITFIIVSTFIILFSNFFSLRCWSLLLFIRFIIIWFETIWLHCWRIIILWEIFLLKKIRVLIYVLKAFIFPRWLDFDKWIHWTVYFWLV